MTDRTHPDSGELDAPGIVPELRAEIERLRAELDELKAQEPVYYAPKNAVKNRATTMLVGLYAVNPTDVPLYTRPVTSVPARLTPDGKYGKQHHYAEGWNDCIDAMLQAKEET